MSRASIIATMLAHEGGWDEILLVSVPILVIIALLAVVKRRVDATLPETDDAASDE